MAPFLPLLALVFRRLFEFPGRYISCVPGIYLYAGWRHIVTFWLWVICALWAVSIVNQLTIRCGLPPGVAPINQWGLSDQINPTVGGLVGYCGIGRKPNQPAGPPPKG